MKKFIRVGLLVFIAFSVLLGEDYYQNYVNYEIAVTLNDSRHFLYGRETIIYYNNFPDTLSQIHLLLYPNAYKNNHTQFARQQRKFGKFKFLSSKPHERGYIEIDSLLVNHSAADLIIPEDSISTGYINLKKPLLPGDSLKIYLKWQVKIPASFSRMCHTGQKYYLSQWFPKIPVYDHAGWHPYPYLTIGEFYYEFGDYEVSITLPENYVVAATGELITPQSEHDFLDSLNVLAKEVMAMPDKEHQNWVRNHENPPSASELKTLTFTAENVVDFAWTASKEHLAQKAHFAYPGTTDSIGVWNFFYPKNRQAWQDALTISKATLRSYGKLCGPYPYPNVISVDGDLIAGGGMEYPMLTIINTTNMPQRMWSVIGHEIGHNWFYGILGFNERLQAWMDEGLNTYGELRFMEEEFPDSLAVLYKFPFVQKRLKNLNTQNMYQVMLNSANYLKMTEPGDLNSKDYESSANYFISTYNRPAMGLRLMEQYVGTKNFTRAMNNFYQEWKFKHPQPQDMKKSFENSLKIDLDWFFEDFIRKTDLPDYVLTDFDVKKTNNGFLSTVKIQNKGQTSQPVSVALYRDKGEVAKQWVFNDSEAFELEFVSDTEPEEAVLNPDIYTMETNYYNNYSKLLPPVDMNLIFDLPAPNRYMINYLPYLNYNYNEGFKIGGGLYHLSGAPPKNTYLTYGSYATKSEEIDVNFRYFTKLTNLWKQPNFHLHLSHDSFLNKFGGKISITYFDNKQTQTKLTFSSNFLNIKNTDYLDDQYWKAGDFFSTKLKNTSTFKHNDHKIENNINLNLISTAEKDYLKFSSTFTSTQKMAKFEIKNRLFIGSFIGNVDGLPTQFRFFTGGSVDPEFDQFYVYDRAGKTALSPLRNYLISEGVNLKGYQQINDNREQPGGNDWSFGYNAQVKRGPVFLFLDAGNVFSEEQDYELLWDAGFGLDLFLFQFYFPLYVSEPFDNFNKFSNWKALKKRWMLSVELPNISIF